MAEVAFCQSIQPDTLPSTSTPMGGMADGGGAKPTGPGVYTVEMGPLSGPYTSSGQP